MKHSILSAAALAVFSLATAGAATVGHTFKGVTTSQPSALDTEFPAGTQWTLRVEWDDSAAATFASDTQSSFPLTKLTLTLQGASGSWTTSSLPGEASFGLGKFGGSHEIQFTSGWGPGDHSNQTIGSLQPWSINVTLSDPTGTALPNLTPVPSSIDLSKWDAAASEFKMYLSENAFQVMRGTLDLVPDEPEISVKIGKELKDGKSTLGFGKLKLGKKPKSKIRTLTIRNTGTVPLEGIGAKVTGKAKKEFKVRSPKKSTLAPGGSMKIKVVFKPKKPGTRKAVLKILSNDADEGSFDIKLSAKVKKGK